MRTGKRSNSKAAQHQSCATATATTATATATAGAPVANAVATEEHPKPHRRLSKRHRRLRHRRLNRPARFACFRFDDQDAGPPTMGSGLHGCLHGPGQGRRSVCRPPPARVRPLQPRRTAPRTPRPTRRQPAARPTTRTRPPVVHTAADTNASNRPSSDQIEHGGTGIRVLGHAPLGRARGRSRGSGLQRSRRPTAAPLSSHPRCTAHQAGPRTPRLQLWAGGRGRHISGDRRQLAGGGWRRLATTWCQWPRRSPVRQHSSPRGRRSTWSSATATSRFSPAERPGRRVPIRPGTSGSSAGAQEQVGGHAAQQKKRGRVVWVVSQC